MRIIGVLWLIFIVLKAVGVIAASWALVILWPIPVILLLWLIFMIFGVAFVSIGSRLTRR